MLPEQIKYREIKQIFDYYKIIYLNTGIATGKTSNTIRYIVDMLKTPNVNIVFIGGSESTFISKSKISLQLNRCNLLESKNSNIIRTNNNSSIRFTKDTMGLNGSYDMVVIDDFESFKEKDKFDLIFKIKVHKQKSIILSSSEDGNDELIKEAKRIFNIDDTIFLNDVKLSGVVRKNKLNNIMKKL